MIIIIITVTHITNFVYTTQPNTLTMQGGMGMLISQPASLTKVKGSQVWLL